MTTRTMEVSREAKVLTGLEPLPDSRARELRGCVYDSVHGWWLQPIFCASCGKPGGLVPEHITFAFYLCTSPCWEKYGHLTGTMAVPDFIVREAIRMEGEEKLKSQMGDHGICSSTTLLHLPQ